MPTQMPTRTPSASEALAGCANGVCEGVGDWVGDEVGDEVGVHGNKGNVASCNMGTMTVPLHAMKVIVALEPCQMSFPYRRQSKISY